MKVIANAIRQLWGLFVDDGRLAIALIVWCGFAFAGGFSALGIPSQWRGPVFVLGCLAILVVNVLDSARRLRGR